MNKLPKIGESIGGWGRVGLLRVEVSEGTEFPFGYGLSYLRYDCHKGVCYPLGLNWIIWLFRELWLIMVSTPKGIEYKSYQFGLRDGEKTFQSNEYMKLVDFVKTQYEKKNEQN